MKKVIMAAAFTLASFSTTSALAGDVAAGETKYNQVCASCHGNKGSAPIMPTYPKLAGQNAAYLELAIKSYKDGQRTSPNAAAMTAMAAMLATEDDIKNVAAYLAAQ